MTVEVNIDYLLENKVTANEFIVLQMLIENQTKRLDSFQEVVGNEAWNKIIQSLQKMEFLDTDLNVTEKCLKTFKGKGRFEELYMLYPVSVIRPDGKRESLRTDKKRCATKYNRIAKRADIHEKIMKCLQYEIEERTKNNSLKYMKKLPNWLSSEAWNEYDEKMKVNSLLDQFEEDIDDGTDLL